MTSMINSESKNGKVVSKRSSTVKQHAPAAAFFALLAVLGFLFFYFFIRVEVSDLHANVSVGDVVRFGPYNWRVLEVRNNQALVLSEHVLFDRRYHHTWEAVTWETSEIRHYLNNDFFGRFSPQEQALIATATVTNDDNQWFGTPGGNTTLDRIFLLSIEEVVVFFGDSGQLTNRPAEAHFIWDEYNRARRAWNL